MNTLKKKRITEPCLHSFVFDGSDLTSGIYFVKAVVPGQLNETRKVVLMK